MKHETSRNFIFIELIIVLSFWAFFLPLSSDASLYFFQNFFETKLGLGFEKILEFKLLDKDIVSETR